MPSILNFGKLFFFNLYAINFFISIDLINFKYLSIENYINAYKTCRALKNCNKNWNCSKYRSIIHIYITCRYDRREKWDVRVSPLGFGFCGAEKRDQRPEVI